jgi:hypothetical protein
LVAIYVLILQHYGGALNFVLKNFRNRKMKKYSTDFKLFTFFLKKIGSDFEMCGLLIVEAAEFAQNSIKFKS